MSFQKSAFKVWSAASVLKLVVFRKLNHFHWRDQISHSLGSGSKLCWVWIKGVFLQKVGGDTSLLGCFSPSCNVSTWWLFPNPPLIAHPSKWYIIKSFFFFFTFLWVNLLSYTLQSAGTATSIILPTQESIIIIIIIIGSWQTLSFPQPQNPVS